MKAEQPKSSSDLKAETRFNSEEKPVVNKLFGELNLLSNLYKKANRLQKIIQIFTYLFFINLICLGFIGSYAAKMCGYSFSPLNSMLTSVAAIFIIILLIFLIAYARREKNQN
jgi:preprotein translocase subunit SecG